MTSSPERSSSPHASSSVNTSLPIISSSFGNFLIVGGILVGRERNVYMKERKEKKDEILNERDGVFFR